MATGFTGGANLSGNLQSGACPVCMGNHPNSPLCTVSMQSQNVVSTTAYPYVGSHGSSNNTIKLYICWGCGEEYTLVAPSWNYLADIKTCETCAKKIQRSIMKLFTELPEERCSDCYRHINACSCPMSKKIDSLKS